jgi:hypothetical protein
MIPSKNAFLKELHNQLKAHPDRENILQDYGCHVDELFAEIGFPNVTEDRAMAYVIERLGSPEEIAESWKSELNVTPNRTKWLFFLFNLCFFIGGALLTMFYHLVDWHWVQILWNTLTSIPFVIMFLYSLFWGLLGYEIGKEYGHGGRSLLKKTFIISLLPNLIMMGITVFKIVPYEWFHPLLSVSFITICIVSTLLLFPVSWIGYLWGKRVSV